jgi:lipoprotein-anchoring transpeptidase ErfK/SrfK
MPKFGELLLPVIAAGSLSLGASLASAEKIPGPGDLQLDIPKQERTIDTSKVKPKIKTETTQPAVQPNVEKKKTIQKKNPEQQENQTPRKIKKLRSELTKNLITDPYCSLAAKSGINNAAFVSLNAQTLTVCRGGRKEYKGLVSTGIAGEHSIETRTGAFKINEYRENALLSGIGYKNVYVSYLGAFDGNIAFHPKPEGSTIPLGQAASHGCVRTEQKAKEFIHRLGVGGRVFVFKTSPELEKLLKTSR